MSNTENRDRSASSEHQKLIDNWFEYHRLLEESGDLTGETNIADVYLPAIERLENFVKNEPDVGWSIVLEIFVRTESDYQRASLAAGLLEDLLGRHGKALIDRIEMVAERDNAFRALLIGVWRNAIPDDIWERIQRLIRDK